MNDQLTEIMMIVDRSGSMREAGKEQGAIAGFNEFLLAQHKEAGEARVSLCLFDHETILVYDSIPIAEVMLLDALTYVPRGSTALLDSIGKMVDYLGYKLENTPEAERPGKVIVVILTDGLENASHTFTLDAIKRKIEIQTLQYKWEFIFLSSNLDSLVMAVDMGIPAANTVRYADNRVGTQESYLTTSDMVSRMRNP